jgi:hypothetical protein
VELAAQRRGNRLPEARFADTRRAYKAQNRAARLRIQASHGNILQYALFDLLKT